MVMELTNTSMEAIYSDFSGSKSIVIDLDMIYNFEKQGDQ